MAMDKILRSVTQKASRYFWAVLLLGMGLNIFTMGLAAYWHRPLFVDGSFWFFNILAFREPFIAPHFLRWTDILLQAPALGYLRLASTPRLDIALSLLEWVYALHPLVSLTLTAVICYRRRRPEVFIFPILSFALVTQSTLAFSVGVVPEALSIFWPIFALMLLTPELKAKHIFAILVFTLALALSYEGAVLFFGLLLAMRPRSTIVQLAFLGGFLWCAYRILGPDAGPTVYFWISISRSVGAFRFLGFGLLILLCLIIFGKNSNRAYRNLSLAAVGAAGLYFFASISNINSIWHSLDARTTAIPMALVLALVAWSAAKSCTLTRHVDQMMAVLILVALSLFASAVHDFRISQAWHNGLQRLETEIQTRKGCVEISESIYIEYLQPNGFAGRSLPYVSILLQAKGTVETMIYSNSFGDGERPVVLRPTVCTDIANISVLGKSKQGIPYSSLLLTRPAEKNLNQ